jgi:parvulin-like peptidyl-prolyl isomerase
VIVLASDLASIVLLTALASLPGPIQDPPALPDRLPAVLDFEQHRGLVLAEVDGNPVRLGELATHLRTHYAPDIFERWGGPDGGRELNSPALSQLLYQFVDLLCLRAEARVKGVEMAELPAAIDSKLAESFEEYLLQVQKAGGRKAPPLTEHAVEHYRQRHRREQGLQAEIAALLDRLVPPNYTHTELRDFLVDYGRFFGGQVKFAHIFFRLRDENTGRLLPEAERQRVMATARDVQSRAREHPDAFAELARKFSQDAVTRDRGGELAAWVTRFNKLLPAPLVRAAWELPDGGVSDLVETFYGVHVVRRLKFVQNTYVLLHGKQIERIRRGKSQFDQEAFLQAMRQRHARRLFY